MGDRRPADVRVVVGLDRPRLPGGVLAGAPRARHARERRRLVGSGVGIDPALDRGGEHEGLERRARLAGRLRSEVELVLRVARDDGGHRTDRARPGLDGDDGRGRIVAVGERLTDRAVRRALETRLDRGVDAKAAFTHRTRAVDTDELVEDVREEVRLLDLRVEPSGHEVQRVAARVPVLGARDVAVAQHGVEHLVASRDRAARVVERVVDRRRLRQACEQRRLRQRQLPRMPREVRLRRRFDAVGVVPVVDGVEIAGEDLVLRPAAAQLDRETRFLDLPLEGALAPRVAVPHELLRDRRPPFDEAACPNVGPHCTHVAPESAGDADVVDAAVLIEPAVLDRDRRGRQPVRHPLQHDGLPVSLGRDRAEQRAVRRVDEGVLADRGRAERVEVAADRERRPGAEPGEDDDHDECDQRCRDERAGPFAAAAALEPVAAFEPVFDQIADVAVAGGHLSRFARFPALAADRGP